MANKQIIESYNQLNKVPDEAEVTSTDSPASTFEELKLCAEPSKIEACTQAHNGSWFTPAMLSSVDPKLETTQAVCICPTGERAIQNLAFLRKYTSRITCEAAAIEDDEFQTVISAQIVIGTPCTLKRLMSLKKLNVTDVIVIVFDNADHMDDGFKGDSQKILKDIHIERGNAQRQTVKKFVDTIHNEKEEEISLLLDSLKQFKVSCSNEITSLSALKHIILEKMGKTIIFLNSARGAEWLHHSLTQLGYQVSNLRGACNIEDRDKILKEFEDGVTQVLISPDLLPRHFVKEQVNGIVNYDLPLNSVDPSMLPDYDMYLHRIGFGRKGGAVFNFLNDRFPWIMDKIDQYFGTEMIEVPPSNSKEDFIMVAMKTAGLM